MHGGRLWHNEGNQDNIVKDKMCSLLRSYHSGPHQITLIINDNAARTTNWMMCIMMEAICKRNAENLLTRQDIISDGLSCKLGCVIISSFSTYTYVLCLELRIT